MKSSKQIASRHTTLVEALEGRRLMSATAPAEATAALHDGELRVNGTDAADLIVVGVKFDDSGTPMVNVTVNDALVGSFSLFEVTSGVVHVRAGKGDDSVRFDETTGPVPLRMRADGGQGDDTLTGGVLDDDLRGGNGADVLQGNDGNDQLFGENGKDSLAGGGGDDVLDGGNGTDTLYGEFGMDVLRGGNGNDLLDGGGEDDDLDGGRGFDALTGGSGVDAFAGTDKALEILDKADEDVYSPACRGKGGGGGGPDVPDVEGRGKGAK